MKDEEAVEWFGMYDKILIIILFALLIVLALFGNLLVCAAILWDRSLRRQPENLFLVSLAVSDLLVSVLVMVFAAGNDLLGYWPFGQAYCQFWVSFDITCCSASILNLCAISLDRYWHISRPMVYVRYCNRRRIYYAIVVVWMLSAAIGALPLAIGFGSKVTPNNETGLPACEMRLPVAYAVCSSLFSFFLPAAVMVFLYTKLYLYARKHVRSIKTQLQQATSFLIMQLASEKIREIRSSIWNRLSRLCPGVRSQVPQTEHPTPANHSRNNISDQKARLTLGVIMGTFLVCWLPFFVVNVLRSCFPNSISQYVHLFVTWLGYANSAANPLIYSIFNRDFRRAFKKIIVDMFNCWESPDLNKSMSVPVFDRCSSRYAVAEIERRRSCTRSTEAALENNNENVATRLILLNNNDEVILEEP